MPAYIDFALREVEEETMRLAIRGGLAWLDAESNRRCGRAFVDAVPAQRAAVLDDIAWPARGVADLGYQGNVPLAEWTGCPEAALRKLGVSYPAEPTT